MVLGSSSGKPFPGPLSGKPHRKNSLGRRVRERAPVNGSGKWLRETVPELGKWHPGSGIREVASGKWHPGSWPVKRQVASGMWEIGPASGSREVAPGKWHPASCSGKQLRHIAPGNRTGKRLREMASGKMARQMAHGTWHSENRIWDSASKHCSREIGPASGSGRWARKNGFRDLDTGLLSGIPNF